MSAGAAADVEKAEQIKWWDALDKLLVNSRSDHVEDFVRSARDCQHPDAQWVASLFPAETAVTLPRMRVVMLEQGGDARALYFVWATPPLGRGLLHEPLVRAAEMGYAPAQASLSARAASPQEAFWWTERAASQGNRLGIYQLGKCFVEGRGCAVDLPRAIELYRRAAELELPEAMHEYGEVAFGERDWERYLWWGRALERGRIFSFLRFSQSVVGLLPSFEKGELGRVLHTVAPVIAKRLGAVGTHEYGFRLVESECARILQLHGAMLDRARRAIDCWSIVARRRGVVKDMRVMIAKMAWKEVWRWGEIEPVEEGEVKRQWAEWRE
jgi:hypothetical protein